MELLLVEMKIKTEVEDLLLGAMTEVRMGTNSKTTEQKHRHPAGCMLGSAGVDRGRRGHLPKVMRLTAGRGSRLPGEQCQHPI